MKKKFMLLALMAMFVCGGAFAQESEAPTDNEPTESVPAESTPATGGGMPAFLKDMYVGIDMGLGKMESNGFYLSPKIGITPIKKVPKLAFEFQLDMIFGYKHTSGSGRKNGVSYTAEHKATYISPLIGITYTFSNWIVRPYIGLSFGIAFQNLDDYKNGELNITREVSAQAAFNTKIRGGGKYLIPNTKFELMAELSLALFQGDYTVKSGGYNSHYASVQVPFNILIGAVYHF